MTTLYKRSSTGKIQVWSIIVKDDSYMTQQGQLGGKITDSKWTKCVAKHVGKSNEVSPQNQAILESESKIAAKLHSGYFSNIEEVDSFAVIEPMLAHKWNDHKTKYSDKHIASQPKLDGIRSNPKRNSIGKYKLFSRTNKPLTSCPHIEYQIDKLHNALVDIFGENFMLDGELYNHQFKSNFEDLVSMIKRSKGLTNDDFITSAKYVEYHIYDVYTVNPMNFSVRYNKLKSIIEQYNLPSIVVVDTQFISNQSNLQEQLDNLYGDYLSEGYEGQMIRDADSVYENKRSTSLLKRKEFCDDEYLILDIEEGVGNRSGMMGRIICQLPNGGTFSASARGNHAYWKELLDNKVNFIGKKATVRYQNITAEGSLRFPVVINIDRESYE